MRVNWRLMFSHRQQVHVVSPKGASFTWRFKDSLYLLCHLDDRALSRLVDLCVGDQTIEGDRASRPSVASGSQGAR